MENRTPLRAKPTIIEPTEPIYELVLPVKQRQKTEMRHTKPGEKVNWEYQTRRVRGPLCNNFPCDEVNAKVRSYIFLCLGAEGQKQLQQKRPGIEIHKISAKELIQILEDIFVTTLIIAFKRQNFICRKQRKTESLEQFHADLVELAARADCGDREDERVRDIFTATMTNEKITEKLLAETRSPQSAYEYAIRRGKRIQHSRILKTNPLSPIS